LESLNKYQGGYALLLPGNHHLINKIGIIFATCIASHSLAAALVYQPDKIMDTIRPDYVETGTRFFQFIEIFFLGRDEPNLTPAK